MSITNNYYLGDKTAMKKQLRTLKNLQLAKNRETWCKLDESWCVYNSSVSNEKYTNSSR